MGWCDGCLGAYAQGLFASARSGARTFVPRHGSGLANAIVVPMVRCSKSGDLAHGHTGTAKQHRHIAEER
jgi:hypothetical protein